MVVVEDGESATCASTARSRAGCTSTTRSATRFEYTDYLDLAARLRPVHEAESSSSGSAAAPRRSGSGATSRNSSSTWSSSTRVVATSRAAGSRCRGPAAARRRRRRPPLAPRHDERWDAIVLDAYYADSIPFHLTTREFLELARSPARAGRRGRDATSIGALTGAESRLFRSLVRTYRAVFPTVAVHPVVRGRPRERGAEHRCSSPARAPLPGRGLPRLALARDPSRVAAGRPTFDRDPRPLAPGHVPPTDVPLLTDDYAPTDALLLVFG